MKYKLEKKKKYLPFFFFLSKYSNLFNPKTHLSL